MQEITVPSDFVVPEKASIVDSMLKHRSESPTKALFKRRAADGSWYDVTTKEFADLVDKVAKGFIASGVGPGDRVSILSATRYEWTVVDYAVWRAGGTTVAIYETSSSSQVQYIVENSGTSLLVVENANQKAQHSPSLADAAELKETLVIEEGAIEELVKRGEGIGDDELEQRHANTLASDVATLVYTSGTTGKPKGVALTHANFIHECHAVRVTLGDLMSEGSSTLLFLPLAHIFARVISVASIVHLVQLGHTTVTPTLMDDLAAFKPSYLLSVPRVFEKVYNSAEQKAEDGGKGKIFAAATETAIAYSKALESGGPGLVLKVKHKIFDVLVYSKLRAALGGNCDSAVSGGAALGARLGHFFRGVGIPIFEGYGLSETTAAVTVNAEGAQRIGTVGRPVHGQSVAIADDGEVLLKGPVVFGGYWKNEQATSEAIKDGWFHTGDIGTLDDGYLSITGRKKELIVTAGGKNVSPAQMEDAVRAHPLVSQALVVGDNKPYIAALVTLDPEALPGWLHRHELPADTPISDLLDNEKIRADIDDAIAAANALVSKAEAIKKYRIIDTDFTIESGELTPTLKLKRNVIHDSHNTEIEGLYTK
ncbi:long-chain fatty acid--CoA ligase [Nocardia sp. 348MFTsu5.1]|uniref:AMP-dependent synthetase/ligase n=1 Tax=Nocardia sp. 348MFTsu5.1 TaxID=1172185 RepID=UPI0003828BC8|nr:long-chain fatty acid--CoA ligase [Nocardia sp. 348MFTsu5.1]